jgi:glycosyltransferase involved in cell wall biosynthesis
MRAGRESVRPFVFSGGLVPRPTGMPKITALLHTANDAARLGRALESLRPCDQVLVVDHDSQDSTRKVARQHGAQVIEAVPGVEGGSYAIDADYDWILCLLPSEALSEALEASLLEWKQGDPDELLGFTVNVREETEAGWRELAPETRLVNRTVRGAWSSVLPPSGGPSHALAGDLLRFRAP